MAYQELSGFKQASDIYSDVYQRQTQRLQQQAQQQYQQDQILLEKEKRKVIKQKEEKEEYAAWEREQLLNSVADSKYLDKVISGEMGSSQLLAKQMKDAAAEAMRRGQGKYAKDFLDIAGKYDQEANKYEAGQIQLQDVKLDQAREILSTVNDPISWAYAKPKLAEVGIEIPSQFQSWSPETAKWANNEARKSKAIQASERLSLQEKNAKQAQENFELRERNKSIRDQERKASEAFGRELRNAGKVPSKEDAGLLIGIFRGDEDFESLPPADQLLAAAEYPAVSKYMLTTKKAGTAAEADRLAKEDILARSKDGTFTPFVAGIPKATQASGIASPTSKAEFDALPSGSKYINPADGKTYIKK